MVRLVSCVVTGLPSAAIEEDTMGISAICARHVRKCEIGLVVGAATDLIIIVIILTINILYREHCHHHPPCWSQNWNPAGHRIETVLVSTLRPCYCQH